MSRIATLSGVGPRRFVGLHKEPFGEAMHPHVWHVFAFFSGQLRDGRDRLAELERLLPENVVLDELMDGPATGEAMAEWVLRQLAADGCVKVRVERPFEALLAEAWVLGALG